MSGEWFCSSTPEDTHNNMNKDSFVHLLVLLSEWFHFYGQTAGNRSGGEEAAGADQSVSALMKTKLQLEKFVRGGKRPFTGVKKQLGLGLKT